MPFIEVPDRIPGLRARARGDRPWYAIKNASADEAEVFLYDEVGGWGALAEDFIAELRRITAPKILLRVNSPGGNVFEGVACANALRAHPAEVTVQVDGIAASIASVIAMAGDRVVLQPQAMIMIHEAAGLCAGNAQDMQEMADLLDKISGNIADAYVAKAGGTRDEWRAAMVKETWFTAEEAVEAGLADECMPIPKRDGEPEMRQSFDLTAYGYKGPTRPEAPKPALPATGGVVNLPPVGEDSCTLTIPIGAALGEHLAEALRAAVTPAPAPVPEAVPAAVPAVADTAVAPHNTAVEDGTWDSGANEKRLPSPVPVATVKQMYAVYDETKVEDDAIPKTAAKLPHHFVNEDGTPGAASVAAVRNALARLPQTEGLSGTERADAEKHLRAHLDAYNDGADNHMHTAPEAQERVVVEIRLNGRDVDVTDDLSDAAAAALLDALHARTPAAQPEPAPVGLAALTAHLQTPQPSAPDWRDRVAHLTTTPQPSSATTRTA